MNTQPQPFEKYLLLVNTIKLIANGKMSLHVWNEHLAQINAVITHLENEIKKANDEFDDFNTWLNERDETKNIYCDYLSLKQ